VDGPAVHPQPPEINTRVHVVCHLACAIVPGILFRGRKIRVNGIQAHQASDAPPIMPVPAMGERALLPFPTLKINQETFLNNGRRMRDK
jgi:hypothetical protein